MYRTILVDPPWQQPLMGKYKIRPTMAGKLPYPTMPISEIKAMPVGEMAELGCHLWLWTTNAFMRDGFDVMESWGFKYLAPIQWVKPSGIGNYVIHRTQTLLLGYKGKCQFNGLRYFPNVVNTTIPKRHSQKPDAFYELIEKVSDGPRLEIFARSHRLGWDVWGNEVESTIELAATV